MTSMYVSLYYNERPIRKCQLNIIKCANKSSNFTVTETINTEAVKPDTQQRS